MTDQDLNREWARSQIEAWADGSLAGESLERMNAALAADTRLKAAAERALAVRRALHESRAERMPGGLRRRLLAIPSLEPRRSTYWWALPAAAVGAAIVAVALSLWPAAPPPLDQRAAAVQDFELAMRYLRDSASVTQIDVTTALGTGLQEALIKSRDSLERTTDETGG